MLRKFDINTLYICPPYLYTVATLPWEIQKSHFSTVLFIHTSYYLRYLRRNKLLYCSLSVYMLVTASYCLRSSILWSVFFISLVSHFVYLADNREIYVMVFSQHLEERNITFSQM